MSNPTNKTLAVALSYDKSKDAAPRVVATGRGLGQNKFCIQSAGG